MASVLDSNVVTQTTVPALYAVVPGDGVLVQDIFGISTEIEVLGQDVVIDLVGEFPIAKETGVGFSFVPGQVAFWDDAVQEVTLTAAGNRLVGFATVAAGDNDATAQIRLNGVAVG